VGRARKYRNGNLPELSPKRAAPAAVQLARQPSAQALPKQTHEGREKQETTTYRGGVPRRSIYLERKATKDLCRKPSEPRAEIDFFDLECQPMSLCVHAGRAPSRSPAQMRQKRPCLFQNAVAIRAEGYSVFLFVFCSAGSRATCRVRGPRSLLRPGYPVSGKISKTKDCHIERRGRRGSKRPSFA